MGIVAVFVFLLLHLSPGDPAAIIAGDNATGEQIAAIRRQLGLDDALPVQFFRWVIAVLQGDLGISIFSNEPVAKLIGQRVEPTLSLALTTLIVAVTLAVSFGVLAAWKVGSWIDRSLMVVSVLGFSVPVFVVGYMLIYTFSISLRWLISLATGSLEKIEMPRSPCSTAVTQRKNWTGSASSSPSWRRIAAIWSPVALSPAMMAAGSPGERCSSRNTNTATMPITSTVEASRRRM